MSSKNRHLATSPKPHRQGKPRWLWPVVIGVVAVIAIAGAIWLAQEQPKAVTSTPAVAGQPGALIDEMSFDYGDVKLGSTIQTVFHVKNVGDKALTFQGEPRVEVREGC